MRRENASQSVGYGLLAHLSRKKSRCALTKCLPERRIRVAYAHVRKPRHVILNEVKDLKKENECIRFFAAAQNDRRNKPQECIHIRDPHVRPRVLTHDDTRCRVRVGHPVFSTYLTTMISCD